MATPVKGVESIEIADTLPTGLMPETGFTKIIDIQNDSVTFEVPPIETTEYTVEDVDGARYVLGTEQAGASFTCNSVDINGAVIEDLAGGTWDAVTMEYKAPTQVNVVKKAIKFTSRPFEGKKFILSIPSASIAFNFSGSFTKGDLVAIGFTGTATIPTNAAGEVQSPWQLKFVDALPSG